MQMYWNLKSSIYSRVVFDWLHTLLYAIISWYITKNIFDKSPRGRREYRLKKNLRNTAKKTLRRFGRNLCDPPAPTKQEKGREKRRTGRAPRT
jgi:hypothetical protein